MTSSKSVVLTSIAIAALAWMNAGITQAALESEFADHPNSLTLEPTASSNSPVVGSDRIAQLFYPSADSDRQAVMVLGQGRATAPADTAEVTLSFTNYDPYSVESEGELLLYRDANSSTLQAQDQPDDSSTLTEEMLQPLVDALMEAGIPAEAIETNITPGNPNVYPYSSDTAEISFDLNAPSREQVNQAIDSVNAALEENNEVFLQDTRVNYAVNDCQGLERQAYVAAIQDARNRAEAIAEGMGVELRTVPSVAESPFNVFSSACNAETPALSAPFPFFGTTYFDPNAPAEVQLQRDVFVTYPIR